VVALIHEHG